MKRFTETTKWTVNPWFRKLPPHLKCLWQFLVDSCDAAGVIEPDWELVSFQIGEKVVPDDLKSFGERVETLHNGKVFIVGFIAFQYGELSPSCKPHTPVFKSLLANGIERVSKGYPNPLDTLEDKDKNKEREKDKDKEEPSARKSKARGTLEELKAFAVEIELPPSDGEAMFFKWEGNGWKNGSNSVKDWKATMRSWKASGYLPSQGQKGPVKSAPAGTVMVNGRAFKS